MRLILKFLSKEANLSFFIQISGRYCLFYFLFIFIVHFKYSYLNKEIGDSDVKIKSLTQLAVGFAYNF